MGGFFANCLSSEIYSISEDERLELTAHIVRYVKGRVPVVEVLVNTGRIFDRIVDPDETSGILEVIAGGEFYGMQTFDQGLRNLYEQGVVTRRDALATATNAHDLRLKLDHLDLSRAQADLEGESTATA